MAPTSSVARAHHDVGPVLPLPIGEIDVNATAQATAAAGAAAVAVGLGEDETQAILDTPRLHLLDGGVERNERLPVRLGLIKAPLDRFWDVSGYLRAFYAGRIQVVFQVQGNLSGKGCRG